MHCTNRTLTRQLQQRRQLLVLAVGRRRNGLSQSKTSPNAAETDVAVVATVHAMREAKEIAMRNI